MRPDRWQKVDEILQAALQHSSDDRKAFIDEACRGNEELRQEVDSLLAQQSEANHFMEEPAMAVVARDLADVQGKAALLGRTIGPYKILSLLGSGGMGDVFRAKDTNLRRDVAIKILPSEFRTDPDRVGRFAREARLWPPSITSTLQPFTALRVSMASRHWFWSSSRVKHSPIGSSAVPFRWKRHSRLLSR